MRILKRKLKNKNKTKEGKPKEEKKIIEVKKEAKPEEEKEIKKKEETKESKYGKDLPILLIVIGFIIVLAKYWTGVALGLSGLVTIIKMVSDNRYKIEDFQDTPGKKEKTVKKEETK